MKKRRHFYLTMASKKLDINHASVKDFEKLPGIGHQKAVAIVQQRKSLGTFQSVNELHQKVAGVGSSAIDQNRSLLTCSATATPPRSARRTSRSSRASLTQSPGSSRLSGACRVTPKQTPHTASSRKLRGTNSRSNILGGDTRVTRSRSDITPNEAKAIADHRAGSADPEIVFKPNPAHIDVNEDESDNEGSSLIDGDQDMHQAHSASSSSSSSSSSASSSAASSPVHPSSEGVVSSGNGAGPSHRSRIPVRILGAFGSVAYKRKLGVSSKEETPNSHKKPRTGEDLQSISNLVKTTQRCQLACSYRARIPSKEHPPPQLSEWLRIFHNWGNAERLMAIDELIAECQPTQVRHMMQVIEPQFQRDFISLLPKELALYVLSFLDPKDLLKAAQTCRYWRVLAEDNLLWREKCRDEDIDEILVYGISKKPSRKCSYSSSRFSWKSLFMRQQQIEQNWRVCDRQPKLLKGHDDHVITCLEFCGNKVVSGSDDNTLKVWSAVTGKCLRTLIGHTGGVWSSQMSGNIVISGSTDRTLKVWNADTGQCIHTLYGHNSTVRCMHLHENIVVSGSRDATLRIWDIDTGHCLHILMGHVAAVRCVQYDGRRVVSGAYDYMVKVWDPETEACLHTLQGHTNRVYSLQFDGTHIVTGSLDTSIRVWDVETGNCLHTLIGHQSLTSGLELKDNTLVSGNADSTVKVWDIKTGQCLQTLQGPNKHQSAVTCLQFNKRFVITSSDDGTVKLWDLRSGEFIRNLVALDSGGSGGVVWRVRCSNTKLVCAVGSRNGTEETKLLVVDFDVDDKP